MKPVVLITGASSGIGAALAKVFAAHGHEIFFLTGGKIIKDGHSVAAANEFVHDVRADEARAASYKIVHKTISPECTRAQKLCTVARRIAKFNACEVRETDTCVANECPQSGMWN